MLLYKIVNLYSVTFHMALIIMRKETTINMHMHSSAHPTPLQPFAETNSHAPLLFFLG